MSLLSIVYTGDSGLFLRALHALKYGRCICWMYNVFVGLKKDAPLVAVNHSLREECLIHDAFQVISSWDSVKAMQFSSQS